MPSVCYVQPTAILPPSPVSAPRLCGGVAGLVGVTTRLVGPKLFSGLLAHVPGYPDNLSHQPFYFRFGVGSDASH